jgi:predicted ATP-dependent endonuclease of OLD family
MFLNSIFVEGYKNFGHKFQVEFSPGLNVVVGENGSGKSAIIDAVRLLLLEDEYGRGGVTDADFHRPFEKGATRSPLIKISASFNDLNKEESVAFLPWGSATGLTTLNLEIENKETSRGWFKRTIWGGASRATIFERELLDRINCIYLPPMRDAEAKLREGKGSRLARLLKNLNQKLVTAGTPPLVEEVKAFNEALASDKNKSIEQANSLIRTALNSAVGNVFGQDTLIQFSESSFNRIVESLRLVFFPKFTTAPERELFRSLEENSLGLNNLIYLATVLAELQNPAAKDDYLRILLIEEPEAHLHPQLQVRLLKFLERTATQSGIQVIVTTHSPVLASAVSLNTIIHLSSQANGAAAVALRDCGLKPDTEAFVSRWLDATKSTLLFAKGVILVEGIAEALILPELAKLVLKGHNSASSPHETLPESLEDAGVAVINMNGIYFKHFMQLFCSLDGVVSSKLPIRCAGITDKDPQTVEIGADGSEQPLKPPTPVDVRPGKNHALNLVPTVNASSNARLFPNTLMTLEYDLAMESENMKLMLPVAEILCRAGGQPQVAKKLASYATETWAPRGDWDKRAQAALYLLEHIDKGEFAQALAQRLRDASELDEFSTPAYITNAVLWACGKPA